MLGQQWNVGWYSGNLLESQKVMTILRDSVARPKYGPETTLCN